MKAQTAVVTQQRSQLAIPRLLALGLLTLLVSVNASAQARRRRTEGEAGGSQTVGCGEPAEAAQI